MTNVPFPSLGPTGFLLPAEAAILAGVQADMNAAFGGGLNPGLSTPQGQLASSLSAIIADCNAQFLAIVSSVDPQYAQGRMQDAIGNIYFMTRFPALPTTVTGVCSGLVGTVIPAGVPVAQDAAGNLYVTAGGTIPSSGLLPITFSNQVVGPIPFTAPLTIYQTTPGWDLITNVALAALGKLVETQQAFESRRAASVAINASGILPAVRAAVLASGQLLNPPVVPADVFVTQNVLDTSATVNGVLLAPHSIYVAVRGGDPTSIATAIWTKTNGGCNFNGTTTILVPDTSYALPQPTYSVSYQVPAALPVYAAVNIVNNPALPSNITSLVQAAVAALFPGTIGATVYASQLYAAIQACAPGVAILGVTVGTTSTPTAASVVPTMAQYITVAAANVAVTLT